MRWKTLGIVLVAVALVVAGFVMGRVTVTNPTPSPVVGASVRVPAPTGRRLETMESVLARLHLGIDAQSIGARADQAKVGTVLSQFPASGSVVPAGTPLSLVLSAGPHPPVSGGDGPPAALVGSTCDLQPQLALTATPCPGGPLFLRLE